MIRPERSIARVYLHRAPVDFRKQHAGLAALVQEALAADPFSGSVFGFINKRRSKLRLLVWEKNGFILWTKSLVEEKFPWPRDLDVSVMTLSGEQLHWLLDGYDVWKMKPHKTLNYSYAS
jgi:transposase